MRKLPFLRIGKRIISSKHYPAVIVELGINHNGNLRFAKKLIDEAHNCGAEIIKHQSHHAYYEMSNEAKKIIPPHTKKNIYDIISQSSLSFDQEEELKKYTEKKGMIFLSTPFSREAANFLNDIGVKAFKIGSGECNNYPLIEHVCKFKKPMIISTGMNDIKSIKKTVKIVEKNKIQYALLHCTNLYPTPNKLIRLNAIKELRDNFKNAVIGLSDHSENNHSVYAGLALGCSLIEKHFVDNKKKRKGPDISASMDKNELVELLNASRNIHISLPGKKVPVREEKPIMQFAFASVVSTKKIKKNEKFTRKNIWVKRPGTGDFLASKFEYVLNKRSNRDLDANIQIKKSYIK